MANFAGRLGIVQRVLPRYRAPFFDMLAAECEGGLGVFAGAAREDEAIPLAEKLNVAEWTFAYNQHLLSDRLYLCRQPGLIAWLNRWNPNALIVEANPRYLSTGAAVRWMKRRSRPVIGWGLGAPQANTLSSNLRNSRRIAFLKLFDALIAYSEQGAQEYRSLGFRGNRVFVAPNAVTPRPKRAPKRADEIERATVLYVGRLQTRKRIDALIHACSALPIELQPKLVIVGDGPERASLQALAASVYPSTEFRGSLFGADLDAAFDGADLFVLPGTGGLAVQQAMAHALPVIVAEGDGSQHGMVIPANGWLLPPGDDKALEVTLRRALSDKGRLRAMGAESFRLVEQVFNLETMVSAFTHALNEVAS